MSESEPCIVFSQSSSSEVHGICPEEDEPLLAHVVVHFVNVGGGEVVFQPLPLVQLGQFISHSTKLGF